MAVAGGLSASSAIVPVTVDPTTGAARFDAIVTANRPGVRVQAAFSDLVEKGGAPGAIALRPSAEEEAAAAAKTQAALSALLTSKTQHLRPGYVPDSAKSRADSAQFIKYKADEAAPGYNPAIPERMIKMVEATVDPMAPSKFKHKKEVRGPAEAPVPVMHSPPRKVTAEDQLAWSIPAAISSWHNKRAFLIPLDKRLAVDGRRLQEPVINDNFAKVAEALLIAERKARQEVETRAAITKKLALKEKEDKEAELRALAAKARLERSGVAQLVPDFEGVAGGAAAGAGDADEAWAARLSSSTTYKAGGLVSGYGDDDEGGDDGSEGEEAAAGQEERERLRAERAEAVARRRVDGAEGAPPAKRRRLDGGEEGEGDREVSGPVALGAPVGRGAGASTAASGEALFDTRLFNTTEGVGRGFGSEDDYNVYSKAWRSDTGASIYRPRAAASGVLSEDAAAAEVGALAAGAAARFRPSTDFEGVDRAASSAARGEPVQFEKAAGVLGASGAMQGAPKPGAAVDVFGLDAFMSDVKPGSAGNRGALDAIGRGRGSMAASAGGASTADDLRAGSGRSGLSFVSAGKQK